jgi:hypothetical protein
MAKKAVLIGIIFLVVAGGFFMMMRRSRMMGADSQTQAGGLLAVSVDGSPMPVPVSQAAAGKLPVNTAVQESAGLLVSLALNPYPPSGTQAGNFDVTLTDANGQPVSDAAISLDLTMPAMPMPSNQLDMTAGEPGKYHASGYFTMRGLWRIEVIITRGGQKQSVFFDVGL